MRVDMAPFDDVRVRQALKLVQDRKKIQELVQPKGQVAYDHWIPASAAAYCPDTDSDGRPQGIERAKALLAEAGHGDGLDIELSTPDDFFRPAFAQVYKEMAAKAGVNVSINMLPSSAFWDQWRESNLMPPEASPPSPGHGGRNGDDRSRRMSSAISRPRRVVSELARSPSATIGALLILAWVIVAVAAPVIAPYSPTEIQDSRLEAPSLSHWLGTDHLGRDVLSRLFWGTQVILFLAPTSVLLGISRVTDRVAVMYSGELVEQGPVGDIFRAPRHPYTAALLGCVPKMGAGRRPGTVQPIRGRVPALHEAPRGCVFEPRCDRARERCRVEHPGIASSGERTLVRCFFPGSPSPTGSAASRTAPADPESPPVEDRPILKIEGVRTYYGARGAGLGGLGGRRTKGFVKAVDDVTLTARKTATVGIVGESGCGKSTLARCIAGLESLQAGTMDFIGIDVARKVEQRPVELLRELQMIFQNPDSTLNPKRTVGEAIARPLQLFGTVPGAGIRDEVVRLLEAVRLGEGYLDRLPRQLSGGEKQRVALARAFAGRPTLVLCDEPLSSLDVSVQAAVMNLLLEFQRRFETTMLFISHDLSVVYQFCDSVAVMYLGRFCEVGPTEALFAPPYHPYTEALLSAVPVPDPSVERTDIRLAGTVPSALDPPSGCRFHTRCPRKLGPVCERESPPWRQVTKEHRICCHIDAEALRAVKPVFERKEA